MRSRFYSRFRSRPESPLPAVTVDRLFAILSALMLSALVLGCGSGGTSPTTSSTPGSALSVVTQSLNQGTIGAAYTDHLLANGGSGTGYQWKISSGALPTGISLASDGALSGTPTVAGTAQFTVQVTDSASNSAQAKLSLAVVAANIAGPLTSYGLQGDVSPVRDPSIIRQGSTYYVFSTDTSAQSNHIPIRCSTDKTDWKSCGYVFSSMPSWVASAVPAATSLWAPDISYFDGSYHLYYAASSFGSNTSAIGLATNTTLNPSDPNYKWVDHGMILQSQSGDDFNAIDPNILVDTDGSVWLTYGSYWNGIFQKQIDPATGEILAGSTTYHLAERASNVTSDPIEGSSLVHSGNYYYLFVSWDYCCTPNPANSNYKIVVGRGTSPHGPFVDESGVAMLSGGGTILLEGNSNWAGPGGQTAYIDPTAGDLIVFHALNLNQGGTGYLFVRSLGWKNGWPVIGNSP